MNNGRLRCVFFFLFIDIFFYLKFIITVLYFSMFFFFVVLFFFIKKNCDDIDRGNMLRMNEYDSYCYPKGKVYSSECDLFKRIFCFFCFKILTHLIIFLNLSPLLKLIFTLFKMNVDMI